MWIVFGCSCDLRIAIVICCTIGMCVISHSPSCHFIYFSPFLGWLTVCIGDDTKAWCQACKCPLIAHKKDLVEHSKTKKHDQSVKRSNNVGQSSKMSNYFVKPIKEPRKVAKLKIAAYVAEHYRFINKRIRSRISGFERSEVT